MLLPAGQIEDVRRGGVAVLMVKEGGGGELEDEDDSLDLCQGGRWSVVVVMKIADREEGEGEAVEVGRKGARKVVIEPAVGAVVEGWVAASSRREFAQEAVVDAEGEGKEEGVVPMAIRAAGEVAVAVALNGGEMIGQEFG